MCIYSRLTMHFNFFVFAKSHFSKASDVYSFGIVLWEIYTRRVSAMSCLSSLQ